MVCMYDEEKESQYEISTNMSKVDVNMDSLVSIDLLKPLTKLVEVVANAIGVSFEPKRLIRKAQAEAHAERIKAIEHAKTNAMLAQDMEKYDQLSVIERRVLLMEQKRQANINNVLEVAAQSLEEGKSVSPEPVNPDWATRFFDIAQDISDETMQNLWGRILAGEVKCPKSYSLRTLDALRSITSEEAQLFEEMAQYVLYDGSFYIYQDPFDENSNDGYQYVDIARLMEIGLIQAGGNVVQNFYNIGGEITTHHISYGDKYVAFVEIPSNLKQISFPIYPLTHVGEELFKLITVHPKSEYLEAVLHDIIDKNKYKSKEIKTRYAKLNKIDYAQGTYEYDDDTLKEIL